MRDSVRHRVRWPVKDGVTTVEEETLSAPANTSSKTRLRLPLPAADLVRMYFVLGRDRLDRAVPAQRFGRYLGFELRCESASFRRHPLGPPHGLVYTLTSCPFFRDHLTTLGHPISVPQPVVSRPALPPHAHAPRYSRGDHRDCPQTGAHHLPSYHPPRLPTTTASSPHRSAKTCDASNAGSEDKPAPSVMNSSRRLPDWLFLRRRELLESQ